MWSSTVPTTVLRLGPTRILYPRDPTFPQSEVALVMDAMMSHVNKAGIVELFSVEGW